MEQRYISGEWEHIFEGCVAPDLVRVVFDRQANRIVRCDIDARSGWEPASAAETADVEDSWKNGNPDLLDSPDGYGLMESAELPGWAREPGGSPPGSPAA